VVALQPETGKELWSFAVPDGAPSTRGVAYWPGDGTLRPRIVFGTSDGRLLAIDAATGKAATQFGDNGVVNLKAGVDNGFPDGQFGMTSPPMVHGNLIITGARVQESPSLGMAGDTRAWDARTGKLVWRFHSVPQPGEFGHETWEGESWKARSGTNVWGFMSVDPALGLLYLPYGSPTYDFHGGDRKGANLFGNSLVALDINTGKLKWHFQIVHHDIWDYDLNAAPILFDVVKGREKIPAVGQLTKHGLLFLLDRRNGKPVHGVVERPIAKSDVAGEHPWPTQPFPVKPAPLGRMSFQPSEVAKVTPEHEQFCKDMLATEGGMQYGGPFTPYGQKLSIVFPGTLGVSNWHGGSFDPQTGYLIVNTMELADVGKVTPAPEGSRTPYTRVSPWGTFARFWNPDTYWPCQAPPWAKLVAVNVHTGDIAWSVPFGTIPELEAKGVKDTGAPNMGGTITTAGGLIFVGATNDRRFRAYDIKTGKEVWSAQLEAGAYATPMTYRGGDGKQYVVIVATGGGYYDRLAGDSIVAFALPE
jgi:glucose dehydrogenase